MVMTCNNWTGNVNVGDSCVKTRLAPMNGKTRLAPFDANLWLASMTKLVTFQK